MKNSLTFTQDYAKKNNEKKDPWTYVGMLFCIYFGKHFSNIAFILADTLVNWVDGFMYLICFIVCPVTLMEF